MKRKIVIVLISLAVVSTGVFSAYTQGYLPAKATPAPSLQTATVHTGDLVILATASGNMLPAREAALSFRVGGLLTEINVATGDEVKAGQVLARLDDTAARLQYEQAKINFEALVSPAGVLEAGLAEANARKAVDDAVDRLSLLISPDVLAAEELLEQAQSDFEIVESAFEAGRGVANDVEIAKVNVDKAQAILTGAQNLYITEYITATFSVTKADPVTKGLVTTIEAPTQIEIDQARANALLADRKQLEAQAYYTVLQKGSFNDEDLNALQGSAIDRLKQARLALETAQYILDNTVLIAPFAGVITKVSTDVGQVVGATPLITLSTLDQPVVRFFIEEADIAKVGIGKHVQLTFEGYADQALEGEIIEIEPTMGVQEGAPVMVAWASVASDPAISFYAGMTANVEILCGEARHALLLPVAALRQLTPGQYAVFVVQPDGQLTLTPVKVGLQDFTNAEILEGLKVGDVVSTGSVSTK